MNKRVKNVVKAAAGGMIAGAAVGAIGKTMVDKKPKLKKKASKAMDTMGQIIDTAQYMFK